MMPQVAATHGETEALVDGHLARVEELDDWTARGLDPSLDGAKVYCHRADVVNEHGDTQTLCRVTSARWQSSAGGSGSLDDRALYFTAQAVENARCGVSWWDVTSDIEKRAVWVHYCTDGDGNTRRAVEVKDDRQTIASLRHQIEQQIAEDVRASVPASPHVAGSSRLRLRCHGTDLDESDTVASAGLDDGDVIDVAPENCVHRMVSSSWFESLILLVIAANAVTMILTAQNPEDAGWQSVETVFTIVFIAELALKWVGFGVQRYFRDRWNLLDFAIVAEGLVSLVFLSGAGYDVGLSALRVVRTLRPLRAALHLPELQVIVRSLLGALPRIANTLEVCALFMLVFSIAAVQWFNGEYRNQCEYRASGSSSEADWAADAAVSQLCGYRPCPEIADHESRCGKSSLNPNADITSFDNVGIAALTLSQSITLEGWVEIMNFGQDAVHDATWPFFVIVVLFGNFVLVNLLMGVIITEYDNMHDRSESALNAREEIAKDTKNLWLMLKREQALNEINPETRVIEDQVKWGKAMLDYIDQVMCVVILINVICLCVDRHDPVLGPQDFSGPVNDVVTWIFVVEMLVKVPSMAYLAHSDRNSKIKFLGFHKDTYRSPWAAVAYLSEPLNIIDAAVVTLGVIEFAASQQIGATAVFRGVRVMRLVKLSTHIKSMQEVCATISKAGSSILYVALLLSMFIFIFAVAGMQIFAGKLNDEDGVTPRNNFDTFHWAIVSTFQVLAGENWPALMYDGVRASFPLSVIFYLAWLLVGQFVTANLFTAVVFSHFEDLDRFGCPADWRFNPAIKRQIDDWWQSAKPDGGEASLGCLFAETSGGVKATGAGASCIPYLPAKDKDYLHLVMLRLALHKKQPRADPHDIKISKQEFVDFLAENERVEQGVPRDVKVYQRNAELLERMADISGNIERGNRGSCIGESSEEKSLFLFSRAGFIRKKCDSIVKHTVFERVILGVILLSTIGLMLTGPKTDTSLQNILDVLDVVVLFVFIVEAGLKIVAQGLFWGTGAYLLNSWNVLDFTAVVVSVLGLIWDKGSVYGRVMRILRVFRALRLVSHAQGMKVILVALARSMGKVFDVAVIVCFAFLLFALLGVSFFKGGFYSCNDPNFPPGAHRDGSTVDIAGPCSDDVLFVNLDSTDTYVSEVSLVGRTVYLYSAEAEWEHGTVAAEMLTDDQRQVLPGAELLDVPIGNFRVEPRQWTTPPLNFDNVGEALLALVVFASGEGWPDAMFNACDMAGLDKQPLRDASPENAYYFVVVAAVFGFFLMDLFVGAIYATFLMLQKEGEEAGTGVEILLTDAQREWKDAQKSLQPKRMRPPRLLPKPDASGPPISWLIHRLVTIDPREEDVAWRVPNQPRFFGKQFEISVQIIIMLNTLVMMATWYGEAQEWTDARQTLNTVFSMGFFLEAILKIIGFGAEEYFHDSWNRFDFVLVRYCRTPSYLVLQLTVAALC
jgi:voltage-dependent calcium channel L type alpha-1D